MVINTVGVSTGITGDQLNGGHQYKFINSYSYQYNYYEPYTGFMKQMNTYLLTLMPLA